jgi:hypothetical protein
VKVRLAGETTSQKIVVQNKHVGTSSHQAQEKIQPK